MTGRGLLEAFKFMDVRSLLITVIRVCQTWKATVYSVEMLSHMLSGVPENPSHLSFPLYIRVKKALKPHKYLLHISSGMMFVWDISKPKHDNSVSISNEIFENSSRYALISASKVILTGGIGDYWRCCEVDLKKGAIWDGEEMVREHAWHAVTAWQGEVYVSGGDIRGKIINSCEKYVSSAWFPLPDMTTSRFNHTLCPYSSRIYAFAGSDNSRHFLDSIEYFNGNTWILAPFHLPSTRNYVGVIAIQEGLMIIGGYCPDRRRNMIEIWREETREWREICEIQTRYSLNNAVAVRRNEVFIYSESGTRDSYRIS